MGILMVPAFRFQATVAPVALSFRVRGNPDPCLMEKRSKNRRGPIPTKGSKATSPPFFWSRWKPEKAASPWNFKALLLG